MKEEKTLKEQVLADVRAIYKNGDIKYAIMHYVPWDFWVEPFKKLFPEQYVYSGTDFNYSNCFSVRLNISHTNCEIGEKKFREYAKEKGYIDLLLTDISVVAPYAIVRYVRYVFKDDYDPLELLGGYVPFKKDHKKYGEAIKKYLRDKYITCLEDNILFEKVDEDIALELRTEDVRVYNCLFDDIDGWPK